jgi:hypothetical protein
MTRTRRWLLHAAKLLAGGLAVGVIVAAGRCEERRKIRFRTAVTDCVRAVKSGQTYFNCRGSYYRARPSGANVVYIPTPPP